MLGVAGDTSIDTRVASVTVNVVLPVTPSLVADTVVLPTPAVVARPFEPAALLTVATAPSEEAQVTCVVRSCVELSRVDTGRRELLRQAVRDARRRRRHLDRHQGRVGHRQHRVAADTASLVADTVVLPTPAVVARPFEPAALLTVATALSEEAQVTCVVRSCVELSV